MIELSMYSSPYNIPFSYRWKQHGCLRTVKEIFFLKQFSFHDIALLGATHLHGCGFKPPIWWLRCLGHPSEQSHTCGLDGELVNWSRAFMVLEAAPAGFQCGHSGVCHGRFGETRTVAPVSRWLESSVVGFDRDCGIAMRVSWNIYNPGSI